MPTKVSKTDNIYAGFPDPFLTVRGRRRPLCGGDRPRAAGILSFYQSQNFLPAGSQGETGAALLGRTPAPEWKPPPWRGEGLPALPGWWREVGTQLSRPQYPGATHVAERGWLRRLHIWGIRGGGLHSTSHPRARLGHCGSPAPAASSSGSLNGAHPLGIGGRPQTAQPPAFLSPKSAGPHCLSAAPAPGLSLRRHTGRGQGVRKGGRVRVVATGVRPPPSSLPLGGPWGAASF